MDYNDKFDGNFLTPLPESEPKVLQVIELPQDLSKYFSPSTLDAIHQLYPSAMHVHEYNEKVGPDSSWFSDYIRRIKYYSYITIGCKINDTPEEVELALKTIGEVTDKLAPYLKGHLCWPSKIPLFKVSLVQNYDCMVFIMVHCDNAMRKEVATLSPYIMIDEGEVPPSLVR